MANIPVSRLREDCRGIIQRVYDRLEVFPAESAEATDQEDQLALHEFAALLEQGANPRTLADFGLPDPTIPFEQNASEPNRLIREERALQNQVDPAVAAASWAMFNTDQLAAANAIVSAVNENQYPYFAPGDYHNPTLFFLDGPGGTGKTFVQNTIMAKLRSEGKIVLAVASSGIAATLLDGGQTAHGKFKIPLDSTDASLCDIKHGIPLDSTKANSEL